MDRRRFLRRSGIALGSLGLVGSPACGDEAVAQQTPAVGGPPSDGEWSRSFRDTFEAESLDADTWGIGWGWGRNTTTSNAQIVEENVNVVDGTLRLRGTHDGSNVTTGGVNTRNTLTFGPGSYLEARIRFADREGFHNAFWAKPNSEAWPPEIDVVEQWHDAESVEPARHTHHHLHYSTSTSPGDRTTYEDIGIRYEPGDDVTENFHVYGVEWRPDRIVHYVDGEPIRTWRESTMLTAMQQGAPFYMMVNLNINSIGSADLDEEWGEEMVVDWVRLWELEQATTDPHYLWVRTTGDRPARFAFRASDGGVELDTDDPSVDYWVSRDKTTGGGTATRTSSLPGFWFDGRIDDFAYEGPIQVFVDDERRDPDVLVDDSTAGPPLM